MEFWIKAEQVWIVFMVGDQVYLTALWIRTSGPALLWANKNGLIAEAKFKEAQMEGDVRKGDARCRPASRNGNSGSDAESRRG